jgi:hypothetical protein
MKVQKGVSSYFRFLLNGRDSESEELTTIML